MPAYLTEAYQSPYPGAEMGDQIPQLSPHAEVRKIGDLTLYIAYENTWNLVQVKCPTLGTKFCIGNAPPIPLLLGGVGLNIDRCIKCYMYIHNFL